MTFAIRCGHDHGQKGRPTLGHVELLGQGFLRWHPSPTAAKRIDYHHLTWIEPGVTMYDVRDVSDPYVVDPAHPVIVVVYCPRHGFFGLESSDLETVNNPAAMREDPTPSHVTEDIPLPGEPGYLVETDDLDALGE